MIKKYKIVVAYDGTDFHGWQTQKKETTVASTLKNSFKKSFGKDVKILGASRTDAGVHALGQTALVETDLDVSTFEILHAWNNSLPNSILIKSIDDSDRNFYPFANVEKKIYWYHLFLKRPLPFVARYGWFWKFIDNVDWNKFAKAMNYFVGEHDFRSFCKNIENENTIKKVDVVKIEKLNRFSAIRVIVEGKGFLRYQIRRMIGAALEIASKKEMSEDLIKHHLENPSDQQHFTKAEACGLCLRKIIYRD